MQLIYTHATPNPNCYKFAFDEELTEGGPFEFFRENYPYHVSTIDAIFQNPSVERIFILANFISVIKTEEADWFELAATLRAIFSEHLNKIDFNTYEFHKGFQEPIQSPDAMINEWYARTILPATEKDGGALRLIDYTEGELILKASGACLGCPFVQITVQKGIAEPLFKQVADFKGVKLV